MLRRLPAEPENKWIIAGSVLLGTMMAVLDSSIVNVALPDMAGSLGASIEEITWVVTGFILSNVIVMPITALLAARFGRKRFYLGNVLLFTISSMLCGLARSMPTMILFRVLQGFGGGVLITVSQAILLESFPVEEHGIAMGMFGMGVVLAPAIGPTLGGWITDQYSWPWIFYINVPIGVINFLLVARFVHDPAYFKRDSGKIDWIGLALMTAGLGALQIMLEEGERKNWFESEYIVTMAAVAGVGLLLFIWRELAAEHPAVDLRILRDRSFTSATAIGGVLGVGLYGSLFVLPLFLQRLLGYPAFESGLALMPRSLAMLVCMPIAGRLYNRLGPKVLVACGLAVGAISFWQLSHLASDIGFWGVFMPQLWQGVGFSLIFVALSTAAVATIPKPKMTAATGLYNVVRRVFGSVGIALAATEITAGTTRYREHLMTHVTGLEPATRHFLSMAGAGLAGRGADEYSATLSALALLEAKVTHQAAVLAYNHVFFLVTAVFVLSMPLALLLRSAVGRRSSEPLAD